MIAMDWTPIIVAAITAAGAFAGVYTANRKTAAVLDIRLTNLEKTVSKHNQIVERTYKLEEDTALQDAELKRINKRLEIVEQERR